MKRLISALLVLVMLPGLCSCAAVYSNYREMEQLLVLQAMGIDSARGGVHLSLASGADKKRGNAPVRLSLSAATLSAAFEQAQNYSFEESLFFAHINSLLIGEQAAERGVDDYVNYICQAPGIRIDIPIYIVKNDTAENVLTTAGDSSRGVAEVMDGVREYLDDHAGGMYSVADFVRDSLRHGSALVCALEYAPSIQRDDPAPDAAGEEADADTEQGQHDDNGGVQDEVHVQDPAEAEEKPDEQPQNTAAQMPGAENEQRTVAAAGYAVLRDMRLCAYIDSEDALGVSFLKNNVTRYCIVVADSRGAPVTLEITGCSCDISPRWSSDGSLNRLDVAADVHATVLEIDGAGDINNAVYADALTAALEEYVSERISAVLRLSARLGADFLALGSTAERSSPSNYAHLPESFPSLLSSLEMRVSVTGRLDHSNDVKQTIQQAVIT